MNKKMLILSSMPRKGGNVLFATMMLALAFTVVRCSAQSPSFPTFTTGGGIAVHAFPDVAGKPNSKNTSHYTGHPAEIPILTLHRLGLMDGLPDGNFGPEKPITRAEFAAILTRALKAENRSFETDQTPLTEELAVKMIVSAMGYSSEAEALGGYPMGFIEVGNRKYISRGLNIHKGEPATRALVAQMLFYALGCEIKGTGKSLYDLHSEKMGERIEQGFIDAMLQDDYYRREEALETMMNRGITPYQIFSSLLGEFKNSPDKGIRTRAARVLSEFLVPDTIEYGLKNYDKAYMELFFGKLNVIAAADFARAANNPDEDEDIRLYALRGLYLLDRIDLADKSSWIVAFKTKSMLVARHLCNKAQDILEMTNDNESTDALIAALLDSDVEVVLRAIDTLGRKGRNLELRKKATKAIPELQKLLSHVNPYVPYRAYLAIKDLGGRPSKKIAPVICSYGNSTQAVRTIVDGVEVHGSFPAEHKLVVVNNGNIEVTFNADDTRSFGGMQKLTTCDNDKNLLRGVGFLTWNQLSPITDNAIKEHDGRRSQGLKKVCDDYVEYFYKFDPSEKFPYSLEFVYRIPRGESGLYLYAIVDKDAHSAPSQHLYAGVMFRIKPEEWEHASGHDKLQYNIRWVKTEHGKKDIYQSAYRQQSGELDAKHETYLFNLENNILGMANDRVGLWQLFISNESYAKLLKHDMGAITDTMSAMYEGEYFTWTQRPVPAGEYHKIYGPMMLYINKGETFMDKWEDAKNKLMREQSKWPYSWVEDPHYFDRGSVRGKVEMSDGSSPEGAYVVVNIPGETKGKKDERYRTWNQNNGRYQYWTRADKDGNWSIKNVMADKYCVTVWKEGYPGEVERANVIIVKGIDTDVGTIRFEERSNGRLAWRIGKADRTWLYNEEKRYNWETFMKYRNRFPNGVEFKVGESEPIYDWNYVQPSSAMGEERVNVWTILFGIKDEAPGDPILTIATCGSRNCKFEVYVNNTKISTLDYGDDDSMVIRTHAYGKHIVNTILFDKSLLHPGENAIKIVPTNRMDLIGHLSYDYIQLEYATRSKSRERKASPKSRAR